MVSLTLKFILVLLALSTQLGEVLIRGIAHPLHPGQDLSFLKVQTNN